MVGWHFTASLFLTTLLAPAAALAGSVPVSVEDRGGHVAILVTGGRTSAARPLNRGDRLELPLDRALPTLELRLDDPTVRKIELRAEPPSLRVQLRHGSESTRLAAEMAQLSQRGDDLVILLPREPREAARVARAAQIAAAPQLVASAPAPVAGPASPAAPAMAAPAASAPVAATAPAAATDPAAPAATSATAPALAPERMAGLGLDEPRPGPGSPFGTTLAFAAAAGLAALAWFWVRRKRAAGALPSQLTILAQVPLGPRARVVWLSAGRREMLISVSEKDVRVLGQWMADDTRPGTADGTRPGTADHTRPGTADGTRPGTASGEPLDTFGDPVEPRPARLTGARQRTSPSLSGLLRLRDQQGVMESVAGAPDGSNGEADNGDTEWARQLVAATRRGALR